MHVCMYVHVCNLWKLVISLFTVLPLPLPCVHVHVGPVEAVRLVRPWPDLLLAMLATPKRWRSCTDICDKETYCSPVFILVNDHCSKSFSAYFWVFFYLEKFAEGGVACETWRVGLTYQCILPPPLTCTYIRTGHNLTGLVVHFATHTVICEAVDY